MEPKDIDKIITNKLQESNDLHLQEMQSAKPFVWSAIQNQIESKPSLTWYHLAAALVLLMISFSFVFYSIQNGHKKQIDLLSNKIDQLQQNYSSQIDLIQIKETQVESLGNELRNIKLQLTDLQHQDPITRKETFVYRTDTVYIKRIEYITTVSDPLEMNMITTGSAEEKIEQIEFAKAQEYETDDVIFPSYTNQGERQQSETLKFKFQSFASRKR